MSRENLSTLLLAAAVLLIVSAAVTLIPYPSPHLVNDLGYHSLCPFAPYSTGSLLLLAALAWIIRSYLNQQKA